MKNAMTKLGLMTLALAAAALPALADCPLADPADCVYVDADCVNDPGSGTQADPFCRIQDAYDSVVATTTPLDPATILVLGGSYNECVDASSTFDPDPAFNVDRPARIVADEWLLAGSPNPDHADTSTFETVAQRTTISGAGLCDGVAPNPRLPTVSIAGTGASIEGFAIVSGGAAGIEMRGSVRAANNLVANNEGELGGGLQLITAGCAYGDVSGTIEHNVVRDNLANDFNELGLASGGGIFVQAEGFVPASVNCGLAIGIGGKSVVDVNDNVVHGNTAQNLFADPDSNDTFASGGGISVEALGDFEPDFPDDFSVTIRVNHNTVYDNTVATDPAAGDANGGGIFASTVAPGLTSAGKVVVEVANNTVGPDNVAAPSNGFSYGGGISASAVPLGRGFHFMSVHDNHIFRNAADIGGGLDLLTIAENLDADQILSMLAMNNVVDENGSIFEGGGINAEYNAIRSTDAEEKAELFPDCIPNIDCTVAEAMTMRLEGNLVIGNIAGSAGGGAVLRPSANADPEGPTFCFQSLISPASAVMDFEGNYFENNLAQNIAAFGGTTGCSDALCENHVCSQIGSPVCEGAGPGECYCCTVEWDQICADFAADPANAAFCDCDTSNCCEESSKTVIGAGILATLSAKGETMARLNVGTSTLVDNRMTADGFVGGLDIVAGTEPDCFFDILGAAEVNVERSIIAENDSDGIGGPPFVPAVTNLVVNVTKSSVFGNADTNPANDPDENYAADLFPGGVPEGNITDDPQFLPGTFIPELCSPVYSVGSCSLDPDTVCFDDGDCAAPLALESGEGGGGASVCVAEGAGFLRSPDINGDRALDGVDLMRYSLAFGAEEGVDTRYNPDADLDRDGEVGPDDLPFMGAMFGQQCAVNP